MDYLAQQTINKLGNSKTELNKKNIKKIHEVFPIPREQKILWADVIFNMRSSGIVLTDYAIVIKADKNLLKEYNSTCKHKKDKQSSIYHYIKWDFFDPDNFEVECQNGVNIIYYNNSKIFCSFSDFSLFSIYKSEIDNMTKSASVTATNIFSNLEAVIPENYAKVNTKTGHGEMAEETLNLIDKLQGKDAKVVGRTNEKNGADRLVDGIQIQTKYYSSGKGCVDACFDKNTGLFRYITTSGEPMAIEVPKDKYAEAVNAFKNKILEGKVPNITDPNAATEYIKQGKLTYKQALNLCKPGTIESLTYDSATGAINCSFAFGITFLTTYIISYTQTGDKKYSLNTALAAGIQVFGLAFFAHMLSSQVARTTLTKQLIPLSTYLVSSLGYKATQSIVNAIRAMANKGAISGAAATKQLAKILRSNVVTSALTFIVFSIPETYNIFNKKISTSQYTKNMLSLIGTMAAAGGGTLATSVVAAKIGAATGTAIAPGVGTAIGVAGGVAGGLIGGTAIKIAGDKIKEDDSVILSRMYNGVVINLIFEYMLQNTEIDVLVEKFNGIKPKEFRSLFKRVMASNQQEKVITDFIRHYYEEIIRTRPAIAEPQPEDIVDLFKQFEKAEA